MLASELSPQPIAPAALLHWLTDKSSLTLRLKALCRRFEVKLLRQWQQQATSAGTGWQVGDRLWLREVLLCLDGQPWVYALTEVPVSSLENLDVDLTCLGTRPLGEVLFNHQKMQAGALQVQFFDGQSRPVTVAKCNGQVPETGLWGRSRDFTILGQPLRVNEVFLPTAEQRLGATT